MRVAGRALAAMIVMVSVVTLAVPDRRIAFEVALMSRAGPGFVVIAAMRLAIALILIFAAPRSRMPRVVRAIGVVVLLAAVTTPWFATDRGQVIVSGLITAGTTVMRINAVIGLALGGFLIYVLQPEP